MNELAETFYQAIIARMEIDFLKKAFDCACYQLSLNSERTKEWWQMAILQEIAEREEGKENGNEEFEEVVDNARG